MCLFDLFDLFDLFYLLNFDQSMFCRQNTFKYEHRKGRARRTFRNF